MATRCAQMMRNAYPDNRVLVVYAQQHIAKALRGIARYAFHGKAEDMNTKAAKQFLDKLAVNGTLFTDGINYDLAHRAAGRNEVKLHVALDYLHMYIKRFSGAERHWYVRPNAT